MYKRQAFNLTYFILLLLPVAPALLALPFVLAAPLRIAWYFLIALKLLRLAAPARAALPHQA